MKGVAVAPPLPPTDEAFVAVTPPYYDVANQGGANSSFAADDLINVAATDHVLLPSPPCIFSSHQLNSVDALEITDITPQMKEEMRWATKSPSEWLRFLCSNWSIKNVNTVDAADALFLRYKPYLKGMLTSQLLCRLSILAGNINEDVTMSATTLSSRPSSSFASIDFWKILGVEDEFDRAHIHSSVERFCLLYDVRGTMTATIFKENEHGISLNSNIGDLTTINSHFSNLNHHPTLVGPVIGTNNNIPNIPHLEGVDDDSGLSNAVDRRPRPNPTPIASSSRDERRARKTDMRRLCKEVAQKRNEEALRRAAELASSNCVPVEHITRDVGLGAALSAANVRMARHDVISPAAEAASTAPSAGTSSSGTSSLGNMSPPTTTTVGQKKGRSSIVISTASDLDQIITHSQNLWAKYKAIAKVHNVKVNWNIVAKDLGVGVKVREKYARMHSRASSRGFDFVNWGHYRIKDYPQYFLDPREPSVGGARSMPAVEAPLAEKIKAALPNAVVGLDCPAVIETSSVVNHGQQQQQQPAEVLGVHVIPPLPAPIVGNTLPSDNMTS